MGIEYWLMAFSCIFVSIGVKDWHNIDRRNATYFKWFKVGLIASCAYVFVFTILWMRVVFG